MSNISTLIGTPSTLNTATNLLDQTSNYLGTGSFSPIQEWERWLGKADPTPIVLMVNIRISDVLNGFLDILSEPSIMKPLSKFLSARSDK